MVIVHLRFGKRRSEDIDLDELFYRQREWDPLRMDSPFPGLPIDDPPFAKRGGYLPPQLEQLLCPESGTFASRDDACELEAVLSPGPQQNFDQETFHLRWAVTLFVALLGLLALLSLF